MTKSKFAEGLEGLDADQWEKARTIFEVEKARRNPPPAPDYASMTDQELADEAYKVERAARKSNG